MAEHGDASQLALARKAWRNIDRLGRNGAPNQALKTAYKKLLQAAEALEKACYVAMQEKSRYVAERIARTEMARAYADGFLANAEADSDIVAFKWKTGTRHPMFDICDVYAKADMYGLGAGIYPKDKLPPLPAHPHCMCRLVEMYQLDINGKKPKENIKAGVANYLNKLTDKQRENLLGIQGNKAYSNGESWEHCLRGWQGIGKQESRLGEILRHLHIDKSLQAKKDNGIIKATKVWCGHKALPKDAEANAVIDHISKNGTVKVRGFYGNDGRKYKEIHTTNHGNSKQHPYGHHGEHGHIYYWNSDGTLKYKSSYELSVEERKQNEDIL